MRSAVTAAGLVACATTAPDDGAEPPYESYPYRTHGVVFADLDGDDDLDLWVANGGMPAMGGAAVNAFEPDRIFLNEVGPPTSWLVLRLRGADRNL